MFAVISAIVLFTLGAIAATLPYGRLSAMRRNVIRGDGSLSVRRLRIEVRGLVRFLSDLLVVPLLTLSLSGGGLLATHELLIPIPLVGDTLRLFDADSAKWQENVRTSDRSQLVDEYNDWARHRGYSPARTAALRGLFKDHWLGLLAIALGLTVLFYWFVANYYVSAVQDYHRQLEARSERYRRQDMKRAPRKKSQAAGPET
jgi:hypothetical protein